MANEDPAPAVAYILPHVPGPSRRAFVPVGGVVSIPAYFILDGRSGSGIGVPPPYRGVSIPTFVNGNNGSQPTRSIVVNDLDPGVRRNLELHFVFERTTHRPIGVAFVDRGALEAFPKVVLDTFTLRGQDPGWARLILTHVPAAVDGKSESFFYEGQMLVQSVTSGEVGMICFDVTTNWGRRASSLPSAPSNLRISITP